VAVAVAVTVRFMGTDTDVRPDAGPCSDTACVKLGALPQAHETIDNTTIGLQLITTASTAREDMVLLRPLVNLAPRYSSGREAIGFVASLSLGELVLAYACLAPQLTPHGRSSFVCVRTKLAELRCVYASASIDRS